MTIQVAGFTDASRTIAALQKKITETEIATVALAARQGAAVLERAAKLKLTENGKHQAGTPTPSAPGSPPAIVTGALRASIKSTEPRRIGFGTYVVQVGPTVIYGRVQELGGGNNLPARPYMAPALEESLLEIYKTYEKVWERSVG